MCALAAPSPDLSAGRPSYVPAAPSINALPPPTPPHPPTPDPNPNPNPRLLLAGRATLARPCAKRRRSWVLTHWWWPLMTRDLSRSCCSALSLSTARPTQTVRCCSCTRNTPSCEGRRLHVPGRRAAARSRMTSRWLSCPPLRPNLFSGLSLQRPCVANKNLSAVLQQPLLYYHPLFLACARLRANRALSCCSCPLI